MLKKSKFIVLAFVPLLLVFSGCSHQYVASADRFPLTSEKIVGLVSSGPVRIANGQSDDGDQLLVSNGGHKFYGSYRQMTDTAIQMCRVGFEQQGIEVNDSAAKTLKLAVTGVEHIPAMWIFRSVVTLQVETKDGLQMEFKGDNSTGGGIDRGLDGAVFRAVLSMLNDQHIRNYLSE